MAEGSPLISKDIIEPYIYEMNFKDRNGQVVTVKDLAAPGYYHAAFPYLKSLTADIIHYGPYSSGNVMGTVAYCVIKATAVITIDGVEKTFTAYGDGSASEVDPAELVRQTETRAMKRVLARALDISRYDFKAVEGDTFAPKSNGTPSAPVGNVAVPGNVKKPVAKQQAPIIDGENPNNW